MDATTKKTKIVIVEDHEMVREGMVAVFNAQPDMLVIGECGDPDSAMSIISEKQPDLVISDLMMPGSSPFDMMKSAREKVPGIRFVMVAASISDTNLVRALETGVSGILMKAGSMKEIVNAVRDVSADKEYFCSETQPRVAQLNASGSTRSILSPREIEVLCCVARGLSAKEIATALHISAKTVERHKSNIMAKLNMRSQVDLTRYAIKEGLINP